jgi:hypothetical protein
MLPIPPTKSIQLPTSCHNPDPRLYSQNTMLSKLFYVILQNTTNIVSKSKLSTCPNSLSPGNFHGPPPLPHPPFTSASKLQSSSIPTYPYQKRDGKSFPSHPHFQITGKGISYIKVTITINTSHTSVRLLHTLPRYKSARENPPKGAAQLTSPPLKTPHYLLYHPPVPRCCTVHLPKLPKKNNILEIHNPPSIQCAIMYSCLASRDIFRIRKLK